MKKLMFAAAIFAASTFANADRPAEQLYNQFCTACHTIGVANAPKVHDVAAWAPHLAKGNDKLMESIHNGINAMPPKGLCQDCTDAEFLELIKFMSTEKK
jgi:cytochrome c5